MIKQTIKLAVLLGWLLVGNVCVADNTLKEDAKKVGQEAGKAFHQIGEVGKEIGHKAVEVTHEVGDAAREGGKEFHQAVTGNSKHKNKHEEHASSSASSNASSSSSHK